MAAGRLHGDDTPVPILAKGKTDTGRVWVYVRDDRPFGGARSAGGVLFRLARSSGTSIPSSICEPSPASCRPTPMPATTGCYDPTR